MNMKWLTVFALLGLVTLGLIVSTHAEENKIELYQTDMDWGGVTNQWRVSISRLEKLPKWYPEKGEPPLSQTNALQIARKWFGSKGVSGTYVVNYILLKGISPHGGPYQNDYFYRISFGYENPNLIHMSCIVLMDGTVLEKDLAGGRKAPEPDVVARSAPQGNVAVVSNTLQAYRVGTTTFDDFKRDSHLAMVDQTITNTPIQPSNLKQQAGIFNPVTSIIYKQPTIRKVHSYGFPIGSPWKIYETAESTSINNSKMSRTRQFVVGDINKPISILSFDDQGKLTDISPIP